MRRIELIRRKNLLSAGITETQLNTLNQRNEYFKNRMGDKSFFTKDDALLIFIADELSDFLPFRNVSEVVNDIVKHHRNLYGLLKKNSDQFLIVEKTNVDMAGVELSHLIVYPLLVDSLMVMQRMHWMMKGTVIMINLANMYKRIENLFIEEGMNVPTAN